MIVMHPHDGNPFFCGNCGAPEWECRCKTFVLESVATAQARKIAFDASMRSDEKLERSLDNNEKSWWQRGYDDGFEGNEPAPPPNDISWSDYMHGYKAGKIKAGW
jgi:hypothetical protein